MQIKEDYTAALISWYTSYNIIDLCNLFLKQYNASLDEKTDKDIASSGAVYAIRAFCYYTLMVLYEPIPNVYTDCSKVLGLDKSFPTNSFIRKMPIRLLIFFL